MTGTYAAQTSVTVSKSRDEIERTLTRYGATGFAYGWEGSQAMVMFVVNGRKVRFVLPLPDRGSRSIARTPTGRARSKGEADKAQEQATRQRWRALALVIKAKLEAVDAGIVTFEDEFAMRFILPDGRSVAETIAPAIEQAYSTGDVPQLLAIGAS